MTLQTPDSSSLFRQYLLYDPSASHEAVQTGNAKFESRRIVSSSIPDRNANFISASVFVITSAEEWPKEGFEAGEKKRGREETPAGSYWPWPRTDSACFRPVWSERSNASNRRKPLTPCPRASGEAILWNVSRNWSKPLRHRRSPDRNHGNQPKTIWGVRDDMATGDFLFRTCIFEFTGIVLIVTARSQHNIPCQCSRGFRVSFASKHLLLSAHLCNIQ